MTAPGPPVPPPPVTSASSGARYAGLAGAVLLAVAGYLGGALPDAPLGATPASIWRTPDGPATLTCWLAGTVLLVGAWWSLREGAPSTRWAYVTAGLWALPLLVAPPLGSRDVYSYACQGWTYAHGVDPYTVGVAAAGCPWLDTVAPIWRDTPAPYGPVFVLLAALAVGLGGGLTGTIVALRVIAVAGLLLAALCLPALARAAGVPARQGRGAPTGWAAGVPARRAVWLALAGPLVGVHLVAGAHNDAVMLGLLLCGLLVVVRRPGRPAALLLAGALLGLAVTVKASAVVVVPFAVLAGMPDQYTVRALVRHCGWLAGGLLAALLVTSAVSGLGFGWVGGLTHSGDSEQWTSPPTAVGFVVDYVGALVGRDPQAVPVLRAVALLLLVGVLVVLWWRAWQTLRGLNEVGCSGVARSRVALRGAALALVATVVLSPVFHPWYATWPLALLALTAARTTWFVLPTAAAAFLALPDGTNLARVTKAPGALAMTALLLTVLARTLRTRRIARAARRR
ncbi:polyprenol phosphomannose-dependent alpha 1,6 mannosyltransferase MptB [Micromonospora sp. NBC_00362]|uniref:polyprenol phosphomannose-dependent alpha 1,6 mannosyltransferase MptB n=1 Tax=Micromonospora sp. NBC_00362 TaxID=2975975 RepID=UPI002255EA37|nr:polyprenol phosphomannose-dependent alpha 1,6 mannosyltransferase MptB [Micromonospora sp. NBC_00362]MCX5121234.1 polyprenol phosphomannose-dependent alpha 1,6 mannosyltransferase MptB [Micromonospora sp. NBC_00362]